MMHFTFIIFTILILFLGCEKTHDQNIKEPFTFSLAPQALGSNTVDINAQLILDVNVSLQSETVNSSTVYIQESSSTIRPLLTASLIGQQILIKPIVYLKINTDYNIVITTKVSTKNNRQLSVDLKIPFTTSATSPDLTGPTLSKTLPQDSTDAFAPFGIIYFQFSESIPSLYAKTLQINVKDSGGNLVAGKTQYFDALLSFIPDTNFTIDTHYTATMDTSNIKDIAGNNYNGASLESISFDVNNTSNSGNGRIHNLLTFPTKATVNTIVGNKPNIFIGSSNGLDIVKFDANESSNPYVHFTLLSHISSADLGNVYTLEINSSIKRAYVGSSKGFFILDISDLNNSFVINNYPKSVSITNPVQGYGLEIKDNHAYIAAANHGIIDLDISDETKIILTATKLTSGTVFDIIKLNNDLIIADYDGGVKSFDSSTLLPSGSLPTSTKHARTILKTGLPDAPYFVASGINGVEYLRTISTPIFITVTPVSYISNLIYPKDATQAYAIVKHVGIGYINVSATTNYIFYQYVPYEITAIGFIALGSGGLEIIFVADTTGEIHAYIYFPA